jgi:hypothetical protein
VEKTSRLGLRDLVASGVKCGSHGGVNSKMKSWTVSWLSLNTKVEPGLRGSRFMSGDWRRLHRFRGVSGGSPKIHWVPWLIHKSKTEEPKMEVQQLQTGLTGGSDRSDQCATTQSRDFEAEVTHRDLKACVEAKQVCTRWASVRWSDDKDFRIHPRGICIPSKGILDFWLPPYNPRGERMAANSWNLGSFGFPISLLIFPRISIGLA